MTPQEKQKAYWNAQYEAVRLLDKAGIKWPTKRRIPAFKMRNRMLREKANPELLKEIIYVLDVMVRMRIEGAEPAHNGKGFYV